MHRLVLVVVLLAGTTARAAEDDETPRERPPEPPPSAPLPRHIALAIVVRAPGGFGFEFSFDPIGRLEMGVEVSSAVFASEAGLFARYAVFHEASNDVLLGARYHGIAFLTLDDGPPAAYALLSAEASYEHCFGAAFVGVDLAVAVRRDAAWFPTDQPLVTGGVRFGHFW